MKVVSSLNVLRTELEKSGSVALVPTMGNIHEGHLSLIKHAKKYAKTVVCSVFVNKLQFNERADFLTYPRTIENDLKKLEMIKTDIAFLPSGELMYPNEQEFFIEVPDYISECLEGQFRGPFFSRVATIVMKFFFLIKPDIAVFGKKDFQQAFMIKKLCLQFSTQCTILLGETIRDFDGLALSSRNSHLSSSERANANQMYRTLVNMKEEILKNSELEHFNLEFLSQLEGTGRDRLNNGGWECEYIKVINKDLFREPICPKTEWRQLIVLAAAKLGNTRLIDNIEIVKSNIQ
ncbi:pantoate--beta-alanine ligase [Betaproteobacteria bacterium]|nr:pantoate--beta-alanine ligase [Betaproteobacteria bacterium]